MKWVVTYIADPWATWKPDVGVVDADDLQGAMEAVRALIAAKGIDAEEFWGISALRLVPSSGYDAHFGFAVDGPKIVVGSHQSDAAVGDAWVWATPETAGRSLYAVSGVEGGDDLRFVQVVPADSVGQAVKTVVDFFDPPRGGAEVRPWSVVERRPDGTIIVWWYLTGRPTRRGAPEERYRFQLGEPNGKDWEEAARRERDRIFRDMFSNPRPNPHTERLKRRLLR